MVPTSLVGGDTYNGTNLPGRGGYTYYLTCKVLMDYSPCMLHAHTWEGLAIIPPIIPVWVTHEDPSLDVAEGDGGRVGLGTCRDRHHTVHKMRGED